MKRLLLLLLVALPLLAQTRNPDDYERYLLPVHAPVAIPGAYGAQWQTTLYFRNDGGSSVDAFPLSPSCISSAFCFQTVRAYPAFPPDFTAFRFYPSVGPVQPPPGLAGRFLYVERARVDQLSMRLAVGDVSRTPPASAQIPIVPESEFFASPRSILGVPIVPATRVALRVYTADTRPSASITVRVYEMAPRHVSQPPYLEPPQLLAERTFAFSHDPSQDSCGFLGCPEGVRYVPATVQINNLVDAFPEIATAREQPFGFRIEVAPATPDLRFWPLITATRDEDGYVSVYTVK